MVIGKPTTPKSSSLWLFVLAQTAHTDSFLHSIIPAVLTLCFFLFREALLLGWERILA
jgi:hypothetical protein